MSEESKKSQQVSKWIIPIINALKELGGSAKVNDVYERIKKDLNLSEEITSELTPKAQGNKFKSEVRWARAFLVRGNYIDGSVRGIWILTPLGKNTVFTDELITKMLSDHTTGYSDKIHNIESYDSEKIYDENYPRIYPDDIKITTEQWLEAIDELFTDKDISVITRLYKSEHHAAVAKDLLTLEGETPQSYNKPVVSLARKVEKHFGIKSIYRDDNQEYYWGIPFWGRKISSNAFEWKLRPELAEAIRISFPELDEDLENKKADDVILEQLKTDKFQGFDTKQEYSKKPEKKLEAVQQGSRKVYPRSITSFRKAQSIANYKCEFDNNHETFINKSSGLPYLENHHLIPLAYYEQFSNSLDVPENIISLCSNCHNRIHYGKDADVLIKKFYEERKDLLHEAGIDITLEELLKLY